MNKFFIHLKIKLSTLMKTIDLFIQNIQLSPHPYFKTPKFSSRSKPNTAIPKSTRGEFFNPRKKIITNYECDDLSKRPKTSETNYHSTLTNIVNNIQLENEPLNRKILKINKNLHRKSASSNFQKPEFLKNINRFDENIFEMQKHNEIKRVVPNLQNDFSDEIFIKRKEFSIKSIPARFALKVPNSIEKCRKIILKNSLHSKNKETRTESDSTNTFSSTLQNFYKKANFKKNKANFQTTERPTTNFSENFVISKEKPLEQTTNKINNYSSKNSERNDNFKEDIENKDDFQFLFNQKNFGPASTFVNLDGLQRKKTQKEYLQHIIEGKKLVESEKNKNPQKKEFKKKIEKEEEVYSSDCESEDVKENNEIELKKSSIQSKQYKKLINEELGKKKNYKKLRKALKEALSYFADLNIDLNEVKFFNNLNNIFLVERKKNF